ncbi:putative ribonuclease H-like domain-containing protein [Tanacetum coccineum]
MHGGEVKEQMEYDFKDYEIWKLEEKQKELDQALQNELISKVNLRNRQLLRNSMESNISSGDETLTDSAYENFKREKAYKAVPPPTDWVDSDDEETDVSESQKETAFNSENSETSFENRSPNSQNSFGQESRTKGLGNKGEGNPEKFSRTMLFIDSGETTHGFLQNRLKKELIWEHPLGIARHGLIWTVSVESKTRKVLLGGHLRTAANSDGMFFLAYKDETYDMLHDLIVGLENRLRHKVKTIRCDNGTEFKNQLMNEFCAKKGIKREYSIARTPQQNGVAERKNRTRKNE